MTSLNISLPEALKEYVEGQVASGDWGTPSEATPQSQISWNRLIGTKTSQTTSWRSGGRMR